DLATWAHIPFVYTPENRRLAAQMARLAVQPEQMDRLVTVLTDETGHDLAFAVERGKIAANRGDDAQIGMGFIQPRLAAPICGRSLADALQGFGTDLERAVAETLVRAGI